MNIEDIKSLAEILTKNGLNSLEICEGESKIKLEKTSIVKEAIIPKTYDGAPQSASMVIVDDDEETVNFNRLIEIKSPIVGIFYSSASPDADPFVTIGSKVKKGDVLCIIEAMKLMNEITAEADGEIVDICVKSGDIAEYGQVLFKIG